MNNLSTYVLITLLSAAMLFSGCQQMFVPNMQNVPMSKEKGEVKVMLNPQNVQASYTPTDHLGIMANGFFRNNNWSVSIGNTTNDFTNETVLGELGAGYYTTFGSQNNMVFETYAGAGIGNVTHTIEETNGEDSVLAKGNLSPNLTKYFIQPSLGYASDNFEIAFTPRITSVKFSDSVVNITKGDLNNNDFSNYDPTTSYLFFEPGLTFRGGVEPVKAHLQMAYSYKITEEPLEHKEFILNFGLHINVTKALDAISDK